jgi:Na+-driven multidrug efflux pump
MTMSFFLDIKNPMRFRREYIMPNPGLLRQIFYYGMSPFFLQIAFAVKAYVINIMLLKYKGDAAVSAYGIVNAIVILIVLPALGLTQAMQSIAGYNFGAKNWERLRRVFGYTLLSTNAWVTAGTALAWIFRAEIIGAFDAGGGGAEMIALAMEIYWILLLSLPLYGVVFTASVYLTTTGQYMKALVFNFVRQVVFLLASILIMARLFGFGGVLWGIIVGDFLAIIAAAIIIVLEWRKVSAKISAKA